MDIRLDDENQRIYGEETITYTNNSPDALKYLWLQLDQNVRAKDADGKKIDQSTIKEKMSFAQFEREYSDFDGGFKIEEVKDRNGKALPYTINGTMMRIDLPSVLSSKGVYSFKVKWWYNVNDRMSIGGRSGYEYFEEDGNYLYTIAQFYRMCMYSDYQGWQNKQFLGSGEFTLSFGDYTVNLTVPSDHVIASTGVLQNPKSVMTSEQLNRWEKAKVSDMPVMIITEEEAIEGHEDLDVQGSECEGLRLGKFQEIHLGCHGGETKWKDHNGHELLSQGRKSTLGTIQHQGSRTDLGDV